MIRLLVYNQELLCIRRPTTIEGGTGGNVSLSVVARNLFFYGQSFSMQAEAALQTNFCWPTNTEGYWSRRHWCSYRKSECAIGPLLIKFSQNQSVGEQPHEMFLCFQTASDGLVLREGPLGADEPEGAGCGLSLLVHGTSETLIF